MANQGRVHCACGSGSLGEAIQWRKDRESGYETSPISKTAARNSHTILAFCPAIRAKNASLSNCLMRTFSYYIILFTFDKESVTLFDVSICLQGSISTFRQHCLLFHKNSMSHFCRIKLDSANLQEMFVLVFFEKRLEEDACAGSLLLGALFVCALAPRPLSFAVFDVAL